MHHGYVVKVPPNLNRDFLQRYCQDHLENLHFGSKLKLRNTLGVE
jgi:hypothetical protein